MQLGKCDYGNNPHVRIGFTANHKEGRRAKEWTFICWHCQSCTAYMYQSVSQSVLHGESSPLRKCNDPCTSRGLKGHQSSCKKLDLSWTEKYNT